MRDKSGPEFEFADWFFRNDAESTSEADAAGSANGEEVGTGITMGPVVGDKAALFLAATVVGVTVSTLACEAADTGAAGRELRRAS